MTPPRLILRLGWAFHRTLFRLTGGRVGTQRAGGGLGTLFLASRGRRTGAVRRTALFYIEDGPRFVVVASNAGGDKDPNWWWNLQAEPDAEVALGRLRIPVRARLAGLNEAERLWPRIEASYGEFAAYRAKTSRPIPLVILEPR